MSNSISYSERDSSSCHHNSNYSSGEESKTHSLSTNSPQECEYKRSRSSLDDDCTLDWGDNSFLAKASPQIRRFRHLHDEEKGRHEHIEQNSPKGLVGLHNLGNTCFMNAVLQCLMHCSPLVEYFTQNIHKRDALSPSHLKIGSSLATTFAVTCHEVYSRPSRTSVNPSQLKESIAELAPQFEGIEQHDAHEFLRFFLDGLSEELKVEKRGELDQNNIEGLEPKEQSQFWWSKHVQANSSIVSDLFCGQLRSTLICNTCQHQSYCFDPFYDLSLPLPKSISHVRNFATSLKNKMVHASKKEKIMKKGCVLDDCLQALLEDELLSCTNTVICERCKERRECKKTLRIEKFPQVLVLHLKRFDNSRRKKNMPISIPLTGLNLAPFAAEKLYQLGSRNALYDLFGRIDHSGSASRGHYVASCLDESTGQWFEYNDSKVSYSKLLSANALSNPYILFYKRTLK